MKKIVPDPPLDANCATAAMIFGSCQAGHHPLFSVCAGIAAHDVLVHVSLYLRCAYDTAHKSFDGIDADNKGFLWSTMHSVEMAKGLVDALLDGIEERGISKAAAS
ncbi:DUF3077 domain-containing protein [Pseudomonas fontis]|uniref:DUF3077 domain-containing protein n=1 Tax=Pseudomonas fontis TaxID=2942633 RepID=A0ABT5NU33_9PSED|nr:DUF3077 domain-containing protein [Pseudomonas fontis]MDD0972988.1 DUF3077 domain-containing protein [Pseudomonas fontis]MDD0991680.1 DUF3077 domain-containing protein [Pseudomonas fontis]